MRVCYKRGLPLLGKTKYQHWFIHKDHSISNKTFWCFSCIIAVVHWNSPTVQIKWGQIGWKAWNGPIQNRSCSLGRPIRIRPCILGRPIRICPWILGGPIWILAPSFTNYFTFKCTPVFTPRFNPNLTTNLLHHDNCNVMFLSSNSELSPLFFVFIHSFLLYSKEASLQFPANGTCRKKPKL